MECSHWRHSVCGDIKRSRWSSFSNDVECPHWNSLCVGMSFHLVFLFGIVGVSWLHMGDGLQVSFVEWL